MGTVGNRISSNCKNVSSSDNGAPDIVNQVEKTIEDSFLQLEGKECCKWYKKLGCPQEEGQEARANLNSPRGALMQLPDPDSSLRMGRWGWTACWSKSCSRNRANAGIQSAPSTLCTLRSRKCDSQKHTFASKPQFGAGSARTIGGSGEASLETMNQRKCFSGRLPCLTFLPVRNELP